MASKQALIAIHIAFQGIAGLREFKLLCNNCPSAF